MMDRGIQGRLTELLQQVREVFCLPEVLGAEHLQLVEAILKQVDDDLKAGLSEARYSVYREYIEGMLSAVTGADWAQLNSEDYQESCHLCQDILSYLILTLKQEKEIKKEIVFLPYKASMWDSLESVWQAAYDDKEHCNTYVISIPYADRNPDGSAKEWHCEKDLYPDYVPVLDWQEYGIDKLKAMHPDMIYIHNPYDAYNKVTSVDSQYYSHRLKECTDNLVYIPYFVVGDGYVPASMVDTTGVRNADHVIVQDEEVRQQYMMYYPDKNVSREYLEQKFLALGSPKFDKVRNSKKEDFQLPEAWKKIIYRKDGSQKKIILYNTSIGPTLANVDKVCSKLRFVLETFRKRDDVAFWWRPHPLLLATFQSMHPEVYAEYKGLVDQFKAEGWGIYDESPELHRAIAYSDAYYGDLSSVVTLYNQTGKNIVIQKFGAIQFEDYYLLDTEIVMAQNGQAYIFNNVDSVLYKVDCKSGILSSVTQFGSGYYLGYITAAILTNKIIAFPYLEKDKAVYEYDLYLREKKNIKIPGLSIKNYPLLYECVQNESYIVAYGTKSKIFIYDVKQEKYSCYQEWKYQLAGKVADIDNILLGRGVLKNNILVMPVKFTNLVLELNLITRNVKILVIGSADNKYYALCDDGYSYWMIQQKQGSAIVKYDYTRQECTEYEYSQYIPIIYNANDLDFADIKNVQNKILVFSYKTNEILAIDKKSGAMQVVNIPSGDYCTDEGFSVGAKVDGEVYACCKGRNSLLIIDAEMHIKEITMKMNREEWGEEASFWQHSGIHYEQDVMAAMDYVLEEKSNCDTNSEDVALAGKKVYAYFL